MKRFYVFFAVITMTALLLLAGCNGGESQAPTDNLDEVYTESTGSTDVGADDETGSVAMFDGSWWYREVPTDSGISLDIFCFVGDTVIYYDNNGNELVDASVQDNGDGSFVVLGLDVFGDVECRFAKEDGEWVVITTEDEAVFRQGSPIDSTAIADDYTGKWYQYGKPDEDYVAINEDGSYAIYTTIGDEALAREEGSWQLQNNASGGRQIVADGGSFTSHYFNVTADGAAIWDSDFHYYLRESLIGSVEGDLACQLVSLYAAEHWEPEIKDTGAIFLEFHEDGTLVIQTLKEDGYINDTGSGAWEHDADGSYALTLDDGTEYTFTIDDAVLTLNDGRVFKRFAFFN